MATLMEVHEDTILNIICVTAILNNILIDESLGQKIGVFAEQASLAYSNNNYRTLETSLE